MNDKYRIVVGSLLIILVLLSLATGAATAQFDDGVGDDIGDNIDDGVVDDGVVDDGVVDDGVVDDDIGAEVSTVSIEGAAFIAPDSIQNEINEVRNTIPDVLQDNGVSHAFVLASSDELYIVFTGDDPEEGYATVDGQSLDLGSVNVAGGGENVNLEPIIADDVEFESPSEVDVEEVYENTEQYDRQYVEINANHRSVAVDYEESEFATTAGVLVDEPLEADELFGSIGEEARSALDDLDDDNIGNILGDISHPHVITTSYKTDYWDNTEVTMEGIIADPNSPAADFIQIQQEDSILPTDSNTPILYRIDNEYEAESIDDISEISANPAAYDGETVQFESNLLMNGISSKRVVESATGTQLPPVDVVLHGGVGWDQLPEDRDDVIGIVAASSVDQTQLTETSQGTYEVTGEVISTDRLEGDLPRGSILIAYDLERTGTLDTASPDDIIEEQSSDVSNILEQQANPEVDVSSPPTETSDESVTDVEDDLGDTTEEENDRDETESSEPDIDEEDVDTDDNGEILDEIIDFISEIFTVGTVNQY